MPRFAIINLITYFYNPKKQNYEKECELRIFARV